jgi:hypothetical protein
MTAPYLKNRSPHANLKDKTPEEAWSGKKPSVRHIKTFGCKVSVLIPPQFRDSKLHSKVRWCIFVGYAGESMGYRVWDPTTRKIQIRRDVRFYEDNNIPMTPERQQMDNYQEFCVELQPHSISDFKNPTSVLQDTSSTDEANLENEIDDKVTNQIRRSTRQPQKPIKLTSSKLGELHHAFCHLSVVEPRSYREAMQSQEKDNWKAAINEEMNSLKKRQTWRLVALPPGRRALRNMWIFNAKTGENGEVNRFKARLVVRGDEQKWGLEVFETFSHVIKVQSLRTFLDLATFM